tara:strand:- start:6224 stop:6913 length:690 start_codon:yes stop_codon:yes gene_type:complete
MKRILLLTQLLGCLALAQDEPPFESLFDGKTLEGWLAPDMSYWSVEDGAITATSSEQNPAETNQFLVWQGGDIANFEFKMKFRVMGGPSANSGVQVRSKVLEDGHAVGYQADISQPEGPWLGAIYDEHGRKTLAKRGQVTTIQEDGTMITATVETPEQAAAGIDITQWTDYEITFIDNVMSIRIAGKDMSEVVDNQESEREMSGILALQLHSGPPMKVQFKDIMLKKLP